MRPWAPTNDRDAEARALAAENPAAPGGFAERFDEAPVLLALFADLSLLAAVDRDADRYTFAGGASIYPFAWSILLAAHDEGLGGVITTIAIREEEQVKALLSAPDPLALAAVIALGYPVRRPRRLRRQPLASFASVDSIDGPSLALPDVPCKGGLAHEEVRSPPGTSRRDGVDADGGHDDADGEFGAM